MSHDVWTVNYFFALSASAVFLVVTSKRHEFMENVFDIKDGFTSSMTFSLECFQATQHSAMYHKFTKVIVYGMSIFQRHYFCQNLTRIEFRSKILAGKKSQQKISRTSTQQVPSYQRADGRT